jgi:hypothetical protein
MTNPLFWAMAHSLLAIGLSLIIIFRPGYWAGAMNWLPAFIGVIKSTITGNALPKAARMRWQFTCLICGVMAALGTAIGYLAIWAALPNSALVVDLGRAWILFVILAFALGSLSTGRDANAA